MKHTGVSKTARASMKGAAAEQRRIPVLVISYETGRKRQWTEWRESA